MHSNIFILIGGVFNLAFALFHLFFWSLFNWQQELTKLSQVNMAIMQVLNLCLTFVFIMFAYISTFHTQELISTTLGKRLLILIGLFWLARAIEQVIFFPMTNLISLVFLLIFLLGSFCYFSVLYVVAE